MPEVPASLRSWMSAVSEIVRSVNAVEPPEKVRPELELIDCSAARPPAALETARLRSEQQEVIRELSRANDELRRGRARA